MNWDQIEGNWKQFKGKAEAKWGDISGNDWQRAKGKRDELVGLIQKHYGRTREAAEQEVDQWSQEL